MFSFSIEQFALALLIIAASVLVSSLVVKILKNTKWLTKRTASTLDETVISLLTRPIYLGFVTAGIVLAIYSLWPEALVRGRGYGDLIFILVAIWLAHALSRLIIGVINWYENEMAPRNGNGQVKGTFGFLEKLIVLFIWGLAVLIVLHKFGVDVTALFAGLGIAGLALAFALQDTLGGVFSAIYLAIDKPVRQGDFVKLSDGTEGFVEDISMRSTRIRTYTNNLVIVPNRKMADMIITNYYMPAEEVGFKVSFGVGYNSDLDQVEKICVKVAKEVLKCCDPIKDFEPVVRFSEFGDSAINLNVILRVKQFADQYVIKHDYIKAVKKAFEREGIEIPFPQMDVHLDKNK
ncbi:mechanosensitive ion channel family protein [Patescibacteria group bacterium]